MVRLVSHPKLLLLVVDARYTPVKAMGSGWYRYYDAAASDNCVVCDVSSARRKTLNVDIYFAGSYGVVCSANDSKTEEKVAIKKCGNIFADLIDGKRVLRVTTTHQNCLFSLPPPTTTVA